MASPSSVTDKLSTIHLSPSPTVSNTSLDEPVIKNAIPTRQRPHLLSTADAGVPDSANTTKAAMYETADSETSVARTFFDLPPELRNAVYEQALREDSKVLPGTGKEPALFKVCRQVREEALQMFYSLNDLEFYIWPSQIHWPQAPAYRWAYYHIGGNSLEVGQCLSIKTNRFSLELEQKEIEGKVGLVLKPGNQSLNDHGGVKYGSIQAALDFVFRNKEMDMVPWLAHNVVHGIVQYMSCVSHAGKPTALEYIGGGQSLGVDREGFWKRW